MRGGTGTGLKISNSVMGAVGDLFVTRNTVRTHSLFYFYLFVLILFFI